MKKTVERYGDVLAFGGVAEFELRYPGANLDASELRDTWKLHAFVHADYQNRDLVIADDAIALTEGLNTHRRSVARPGVRLDVILAYSDDVKTVQAQMETTNSSTVYIHGKSSLHAIGPRAYATCERWAKKQPHYVAESNWTAELLLSELPDNSSLSLRFDGAEDVLHSLQAKGRFRHGQPRPAAVKVICWPIQESTHTSQAVIAQDATPAPLDNMYPLLSGLLVQSQGT